MKQSIFAHDISGSQHHLRTLGLVAAFGADDSRDAADTEEEAEAEDAGGAMARPSGVTAARK